MTLLLSTKFKEVMQIKLLLLLAVLIVVNGLCQLAKNKWR